jgi:hypothetical protein
MVYDPSTVSNINEVRTTHIDLNLKVDFEHKILDGTVTLKLTSITDIDKVILDTRDLNVKSISQAGKQLKVQYNVLYCMFSAYYLKYYPQNFFFATLQSLNLMTKPIIMERHCMLSLVNL